MEDVIAEAALETRIGITDERGEIYEEFKGRKAVGGFHPEDRVGSEIGSGFEYFFNESPEVVFKPFGDMGRVDRVFGEFDP